MFQTTLFGREPAVRVQSHRIAMVQLNRIQTGWLSAFLKIYIKALSEASDLDPSVEDDKLLIGDRPRQSYSPDASIPLAERLAVHTTKELQEVNIHTLKARWLMVRSLQKTNKR